MRKSGTVTILALVMLLCALPSLCLPLPSSIVQGATDMPGSCHGHRGPTPAPAHSCCYATHQALAVVQVTRSPVLSSFVLGCVSTPNGSCSHQHIPAAARSRDVSPPLTTVLRI